MILPPILSLLLDDEEMPVLSVGRSGTGTGGVSSVPGGILCGTDCSETYNLNTSVTLTATPAVGSAFTGWSGDCAGTAKTCAVSMTTTKNVTANFVPAYTLSVTRSGSGTVTSTPTGISCGSTCAAPFVKNSTVTLTANPANGWQFISWGGCTAVNGATCTVSLTAAKTVTATFKPKLTVAKSGSGAGIISGTGISCGLDCAEPYTLNTAVTLTATTATGSSFGGWTNCAPLATNPRQCTVTLNTGKTVTANFNTTTAGTYALSLYKSGAGLGTVTSSLSGINCGSACVANYGTGTNITLTAAPATGSTFTGWSGCAVSATNPKQCTVAMTRARVVRATFTRPVLTVTKSGSGAVTGTGITCGVDCREPYNLNTVVTLTAIPAASLAFEGWSGCTPVVGIPNQCTVTMSASKTVNAIFGL